MKKALLVLGFAMCATIAFAQTNSFRVNNTETAKAALKALPAPSAQPVDYKASIFSKDDAALQTWEFDNMEGIVYGTHGCIGDYVAGNDTLKAHGNDVLIYDDNGVADTLAVHGQTAEIFCWYHVADSASLANVQGSIPYKSSMSFYMGSTYTGNDNGYMFMATSRVTPMDGVHHAFVGFPAVECPADAQLIDVRFIQFYVKYYNNCYIDYKINGQWKEREINVDGVDVDINDMAPLRVSYTMPTELANETNIEIRIRHLCDGDRGSVYGYTWAIDNVSIHAISGDEANRWYTNRQSFRDGFYGTMPKDMEIPITWWGEIFNNGINQRTNVSLNLDHIAPDLATTTPILTKQLNNMPADPTIMHRVLVDERGWVADELANRPDWSGDLTSCGIWYYGPNYGATNIAPTANYSLTSLPVSEPGMNYFAASVTSDSIDAIVWDTIAYRVSDETGGDNWLSVSGYRWANDNGIIPSGSAYKAGFTSNNQFVTDSSLHFSTQGYMVLNRFTTGNTIPTDTAGRPWVFAGLEIVPQTEDPASELINSAIFPVVWETVDTIEDGEETYEWLDVNTGFSTVQPYSVTASDLNALETGRLAPSDSYRAVNFPFYNQPVLKPNTTYYFGYQLAETGKFAAAATAYRYKNDQGGYTYYLRDSDPEVANGYTQFTPTPYDMLVFDPIAGGFYSGWNFSYYAMIRPIVAPYQDLPTNEITAICNDGVEITDEEQDGICDAPAVAVQGSTPTVFIFPEGKWCDTCTGAYKIDINSIKVDNNVVDIDGSYNDFQISEGFYNVYTTDSVLALRRYYYAITFNSIAGDHRVEASAVFTPWTFEGIDPVASNVSLGLRPNPATSSVSMNINGVNGMVNCSIIDMSGRVVYNADINADQAHVIDLSNVAAGAYFVRVTNGDFSKIEKLIVR